MSLSNSLREDIAACFSPLQHSAFRSTVGRCNRLSGGSAELASVSLSESEVKLVAH